MQCFESSSLLNELVSELGLHEKTYTSNGLKV